jgi:hypothetical protein
VADSGNDNRMRHRLAIMLVLLSAGGIILAAGLAVGLAGADQRAETTRLVFTSMLPLFGTWVGTVLAFYFARDNLQAATESTLRLTGRVSAGTPVTEVMIPRAQILSYDLAPGQDPQTPLLAACYARMQDAHRHRLPILDAAGAVVYVIHDSSIALYLGASGHSLTALPDLPLTIADLRTNADCRSAISAFGFVTRTAVLAEARATMRSVDRCNDVFVTADGEPTSPVLGWLTNSDLAARQ